MSECWIVEQGLAAAGSCSGRLIRAHLIPKQRLRNELHGLALSRARRAAGARKMTAARVTAHLDAILWDPRVWVPICGGITGSSGHHGALDYARTIRIPRALLPPELEAFAEEYSLEWSLERDYGPKES